MNADVAGISSLRDVAIWVRRVVRIYEYQINLTQDAKGDATHTNLVRAIVLLRGITDLALQTGPDLRTDTDPITECD